MGRPGKPLISRDRAARAALNVIDVHGLEALNLEMVAKRMGVKAPSLYYHFRSKSELLSEVARLILLNAKLPRRRNRDWFKELLELNLAVRRSVLQHPNAAPLLLQFFPRHLLLSGYNYWIASCPLPMEQRMIMIDGLEKLTFGSALFEAACRARGIAPMPEFDHDLLPHLAEAVRSNHLDEEASFIETLKRFLDGFGVREGVRDNPPPTAKKPAAPRTVKPKAVTATKPPSKVAKTPAKKATPA